MTVPFWDLLYAFIQFTMVLSVWSYLYKENVFSRMSATIVIAISTVHFFMWNLKQVYTMAVIPMIEGRWLYIFPILLGLMLYTRLSTKYSWLSSYSYAVSLGLGTGAVLTTLVEGSITGLISAAVLSPFKGTTAFETASGLIIIIGLICSMTYWIFTREATGILGYTIKIGRLFLMASIGILYAEDVLWSQSIFVGAMEMVINFIKMVLGVA